MRILLGLLGVYCVLVVYGQVAMAMEPQNIVPLSVTPPIIEAVEIVDVETVEDTPAQIVSNWDVEEFTRENGFPTGECVMRASYDNNIEVTFKGKNGQLSALRVRDLKGGAESSIKGFISLGLDGNSYGLQSRSFPGQIDASLLTVPASAEKIMDLDQYRLRVGAQNHSFYTGEFAYAYQSLLKCTGYEDAKTVKVVSHSRTMPARVKHKQQVEDVPLLPSEPIDLAVKQELAEVGLNETIKDAPLNLVDENLSVRMETWKGYEGDKLSTVLNDWAVQAGVKPEIDLTGDLTLKKDVRVFGTLDIAVGQLLKEAYGDESPLAVLKDAQGAETQISELSEIKQPIKKTHSLNTSTANWRALQGTDLRKVLQRWSIREGIDFVWDADQTFLIKNTTKAITSYDLAVAAVLAQYEGQEIKPSGALNIDPQTGRKTLIIRVSGES